MVAETEHENVREDTLEGLDAVARNGRHGGRPPVITDDMLYTALRRRSAAAPPPLRRRVRGVDQPDLIIPTGKRKGHNPSLASVYRALAEHDKRQAYPEVVEAARAEFGALDTSG